MVNKPISELGSDLSGPTKCDHKNIFANFKFGHTKSCSQAGAFVQQTTIRVGLVEYLGAT
jgi:hypothetical protein